MAGLVLNWKVLNKFLKLLDLYKYQIKVCYVICFGQTLKKECLAGVKTSEELVLFLEVM
jgi:hypothetical protein